MKNKEMFDFYETLLIYNKKYENFVLNNFIYLSDRKLAYVCSQKTNIQRLFQIGTIFKEDLIQKPVSNYIFNKILAIKETGQKYQNQFQNFQFFIENLKFSHSNLNTFQQVIILNSHQILIDGEKRIYFKRIIYLNNQIQTPNQCLQIAEEEKILDFSCISSLMKQKQSIQVLLKFNSVEDITWILIILQTFYEISNKTKLKFKKSSLTETHLQLFQFLKEKYGLKETINKQIIQHQISLSDIVKSKIKRFIICDSNIQNKNLIRQNEFFVFQPIFQYYHFQIMKNQLNQLQDNAYKTFKQKQIFYKSSSIDSIQQIYSKLMLKFSQNDQLCGFCGIGKNIQFMINVLKIATRKNWKFQNIQNIFDSNLSFEQLIQVYQVPITQQYSKL